MRKFSMALALATLATLVAGAWAEGKKEVTLKGTILCAKCALKEKDARKCVTAIQVKEGEKTTTYYLLDRGNKESYHEAVCGGGRKEGAVTGVVSEKGARSSSRRARSSTPRRPPGPGAAAPGAAAVRGADPRPGRNRTSGRPRPPWGRAAPA
jgi:hypothetical protein